MLDQIIDFEDFFLEGAPKVKAKVSLKGNVKAAVKKAPAKPAVKKPAAKPAPKKPAINATVKTSAKAKVSAAPKGAPKAAPKVAPKGGARPSPKKPSLGRILTATGNVKLPSLGVKLPKPRASANLKERTHVAAKIAGTIATGMAAKLKTDAATKPAAAPAGPVSHRDALAAVAPIAKACDCPPENVIRKVDADLACQGFPVGTAKGLFSKFAKMSKRVERAANQRLATAEHKAKTQEQSFKCQLLSRLQQLAHCLPEHHPTRVRTNLAILKGA